MSSGGVAIRLAQSQSHGPLLRTNTAPVFNNRSAEGNGTGLSQTMSHNSRSSQLTGSTAFTTSSTTSLNSFSSSAPLIPAPLAMPVQGGNVIATNNIINQRADASRSLYQICVNLRQRLAQVPGFDGHFVDSDDEDEAEEDMDPVSSLWRCLRKGTPLVTLYNTLQPAEPLPQPDNKMAEPKKSKMAAFKFVEACMKDLQIPPGDVFALSDLFGDDTTGFVKVTQVINIVLDVAEQRGLLLTSKAEDTSESATAPGSKMSYRQHVVRELVDTERKYVQDLENLHELKKTIEQKGVIAGDVVHDIFLNINAILDFQRRFLIKIETTNSQPVDKQEWGLPFRNYEEAFGIYQPFIANQRKAATIAKDNFDKITLADHPVVVDFNTLDGFLLKPMQRLVKYPLLLKDLRDKTNASDEAKEDLTLGIEASNRVLHQANAAVDRELRGEALLDLCSRVDDWKNHRVDHFGDLILHGHFPVVTGKSDVQKEVHFPLSSSQVSAKTYKLDQYTIYLFERILLCCKELNPNKSKDKLLGNQKDKKDRKDKNKIKEKDKNAKLQLKGRIFMTNVTDVVSSAKPGSYTVQIYWKGDPGVENFIIRFTNEDTMKKWYEGVDKQKKEHANIGAQASTSPDTVNRDFEWMRDQTASMPNPYVQEEEDEEEDYTGTTAYGSPSNSGMPPNFGMPPNASMARNSSSNSLRSRSATAESNQSLAGIARAPPPRFPLGMGIAPPLSLQTQISGEMPSPSQRLGDSYFSPVGESPASSARTSTASSAGFQFPRQLTPQGSWEDNNRYTAPAIGRVPSRESQSSVSGASYQMNGRTPQRPSLPAMASQSQAAAAQQRSRSYSTPDINAQQGVRRLPNGAMSTPQGQVPAVPGIPAHLHPSYDAGVPRSQNNSPNGLPVRTNTQSPGFQRDRLVQQQQPSQYANGLQYPNGSQNLSVSQPNYARSNTTQMPTTSLDSRLPPSLMSGNPSPECDMTLPTQLKVKVNCDGNYVTLVVAFNITYQSLTDRIDAKVGRFSTNAIARGTMRLRYRDEDGDFVTIESDDDIQIAFQEWSEAQKSQYHTGQLGEIELFCLSIDGER
ncbi:BcCDC24, RhoGEF protein [Sclerotinia borealis F-4128]|uniref:BcCDC24, RhoGEF protein n=1 Tax=Sclerotinia borealis (strain F-4128) TaxID=1432307 RepID=W9CW28_SCLBF|nr:BcCDC24, RhoGEF protein [Sclerotinia borealis F-4128]